MRRDATSAFGPRFRPQPGHPCDDAPALFGKVALGPLAWIVGTSPAMTTPKQKAGKKRMRQFGKVEIPQEAFIAALKMDS